MAVLKKAIRSVPDCGEVWSRYIRAIVCIHSTELFPRAWFKYQQERYEDDSVDDMEDNEWDTVAGVMIYL